MDEREAAVKMSQVERSNYYKGLLILVGRDRIIDASERELMLQIGMTLDFDRRFCDAAMNDLLKNAYIGSEPVVFSQTAIAKCFVLDGIRLALADGTLHPHEWAWLRRIALANGLPDEWLADAVRNASGKGRFGRSTLLEVQRYL